MICQLLLPLVLLVLVFVLLLLLYVGGSWGLPGWVLWNGGSVKQGASARILSCLVGSVCWGG